jgi:hypothetical protein
MQVLAGLPLIFQTSRQRGGETQLSVCGLEQDRAAIGAALLVTKTCDHRPIKNIWEEQTLCCGVYGQVKASLLVSNPLTQRIYAMARPSVLLKS